ncbi:hypothetical protein ACFSTE_16605 [Aquimarina hainanensis]|uniref:Uncharacterized protein n=1 Tax=Aquimarina hainanensis TaxID=1578017 RepID=A0ABW5NE59_9FLAO|nr:hypothetical protein [Aquimarina sp. TRL1]QKX07026.1 hypothetical protein HN014_19620 [Aquimarina sp. TRL1]
MITKITLQKNSYYPLITSLLFFSMAFIYCHGIVSLAKASVWFELSITILILLIGLPFFQKTDNFAEIRRLLILETTFNVLCLITKFSPLDIPIWSKTLDIAFSVFFLLQIMGFIVSQIKKKTWTSIPASIALAISIILWNLSGSGVLITANNEIQFWGGNAPKHLQLIYFLWLLNILLVEYRALLPKLTVVLAHIASFIVAYNSEEFFHARILTASHLFVLNCIFVYKNQHWGGTSYASISYLEKFKQNSTYYMGLSIILNILALSILVIHLIHKFLS